MQQLRASPVTRVDRRDDTQVCIEVQRLRVDVVRFAVVVVARLAHGGGVVSFINTVIVIRPDEAEL